MLDCSNRMHIVLEGTTLNAEIILTDFFHIRDCELKKHLKEICRIQDFRKGSDIKNIKENDEYVRFLISGTVRGYIVNSKGREVTVSIAAKQGDIITSPRLRTEDDSGIGYTAMTDTELLSLPVDEAEQLQKLFPEWEGLYVSLLGKYVSDQWKLRKMMYLEDARKRVEWFQKEYPGLMDSVNHTQIASFLNISPVTLSRIINK